MTQPHKAYLITYAVANEIQCVVYADNAQDALARFQDGEGDSEVTGKDWRVQKPTAKRWPGEDR